MPLPNIPAARRAGLPVDVRRLATDGEDWLSPEERYALGTWGICAQLQDHVFMVRIRVPGGVVPTGQARRRTPRRPLRRGLAARDDAPEPRAGLGERS